MRNNNDWYSRYLPLSVAVLPLVTINISYLVAVGVEHLPACIPYFSGCTTVSATGRAMPESLIFKPGMMLSAVVLVLFWYRIAAFLQSAGKQSRPVFSIRAVSLLTALSLVVHVAALGLTGDDSRLFRRISINGFALGNLILQVLFIVQYRPLRIETTRKLYRWLIFFCVALPAVAIAMELAKWLGTPRRPTNNIGAWNAFIVVSAWYLVLARIWWHHRMSGGRAASPSE